MALLIIGSVVTPNNDAVAICVAIIDAEPPCEASIDAGALVMALLKV